MTRIKSAYRARKFATGGAVVFDNGDTLVMRPPPEPVDIPEDTAPESTVTAALETAAKYSGAASGESLRETAALERSIYNRAASMFSAPVSREVPSSSGRREDRAGRITLTTEQREAAKIAGISEVHYAQQLIRLREEKASDPDRYRASQ